MLSTKFKHMVDTLDSRVDSVHSASGHNHTGKLGKMKSAHGGAGRAGLINGECDGTG